MFYTAQINGLHYINIGKPSNEHPSGYVELVTVYENGRYLYQVFTHPLIIDSVKEYPKLKSISEGDFAAKRTEYFDSLKDNKPDILGNSISEDYCEVGCKTQCHECEITKNYR